MKNVVPFLFIIPLLNACMSNNIETNQLENVAKLQASKAQITPEQAVKNARIAVAQAELAELPFYTPLHFKDVQASLERITQLQKNNNIANKDFLLKTEAFKTQELISTSYKIKDSIFSILVKSFNHQKVLLELESNKHYSEEYRDITDELSDLFKLVERNKIAEAREDEVSLLEKMTELEIKSLINIYVVPAERILNKAEDNDADDYAELTYEKAEFVIEQTREFIQTNYRQRTIVETKSQQAIIAAKRALNVGQLSKEIVDLNSDESELKALEIEAIMGLIIQGMQLEGLEGFSLRAQAKKLAEHAQQQKTKVNQLSNRLAQFEQVN